MDWKRLDRARRSAGGPIEVDLIEAYAKGKIKRRDFVKRGTMIGLSVPLMGSIIAACGSDDDSSGSSDSGSDGTAAPGTDASGGGSGATGGDLIAGIQTGDANSGLDPINMLDLGTYSVVSQSFEYLVGLADDGGIGADRAGHRVEPERRRQRLDLHAPRRRDLAGRHARSPSADVAATIDRMVVAGAGLAGVVSEGAVETPDELTVGDQPRLAERQPAGARLDLQPAVADHPGRLHQRHDARRASRTGPAPGSSTTSIRRRSGRAFVPNPNWWGGSVNLDSVTLQGFDSGGTQVAAMAAGEIDVIQQFSVSDGANLIDDSTFTLLKPPSANHRQMWFNTQLPDGGPFTDPRVRQAAAFAVNRQQLVDTIYEGAGDHRQRPPGVPDVPVLRRHPGAAPVRPRDG